MIQVDYACTAEIVRQHFQACGVVNRVTILTNSSGHPKGCAYVEFMEIDSVNNALSLNESVLHGRILKVFIRHSVDVISLSLSFFDLNNT